MNKLDKKYQHNTRCAVQKVPPTWVLRLPLPQMALAFAASPLSNSLNGQRGSSIGPRHAAGLPRRLTRPAVRRRHVRGRSRGQPAWAPRGRAAMACATARRPAHAHNWVERGVRMRALPLLWRGCAAGQGEWARNGGRAGGDAAGRARPLVAGGARAFPWSVGLGCPDGGACVGVRSGGAAAGAGASSSRVLG